MTELKSSEIHLYLDAVLSLLEARDFQQAINLLVDLTEKYPTIVPFHILLGLAYAQQDSPGLEEGCYRKALQLNPSEPTAVKALGLYLSSKSRHLEALPYLNMSFENDQFESAIVDALILAIEETTGDEAEIISILEEAYQRTNNSIYAVMLGKRYFFDDKPEMAVEILESLPDDETAYLRDKYLARAYSDVGQFEKAISILFEYLDDAENGDEAKNELSRIYNELAKHYEKNRNYDKALEYCELAISLTPNDVSPYITKSLTLLNQKKTEEAINSINIGLRLVKGVDTELAKLSKEIFWKLRIMAYTILGEEDLYVHELLKELQSKPDDEFLVEESVKILIEKGDMQAALGIIEGSSLKVSLPAIFPYYFYILHYFGRIEEANALLVQFSQESRNQFVEGIITLATNDYVAGRKQPAISSLRQLASLELNNNHLNTNLGYFLTGESEFSEAEALLNKVYCSKNRDYYEKIALCDLIYLYCIQGNYDEAINLLQRQLTPEEQNETAILRIPLFVFGEMKPDHTPVPGRDLTIGSAYLACCASAYMAIGEFAKSENNLSQLTEVRDEFLKNLLLGNLMLAKKQNEEAEVYWRQAIDLSTYESDKNFIIGLLNRL